MVVKTDSWTLWNFSLSGCSSWVLPVILIHSSYTPIIKSIACIQQAISRQIWTNNNFIVNLIPLVVSIWKDTVKCVKINWTGTNSTQRQHYFILFNTNVWKKFSNELRNEYMCVLTLSGFYISFISMWKFTKMQWLGGCKTKNFLARHLNLSLA